MDFINSLVTNSEALVIPMVEQGLVPEFLIRSGIRSMCADRRAKVDAMTVEQKDAFRREYVEKLRSMPIAIETEKANEQHYEVPAEFYEHWLGPCRKYSSGYWPSADTTFEESETLMLELYCERAQLEDGMRILDLGCGWGSVSLFVAAKYPNASVVGLSNSNSQREFIMARAQERGISNLEIITGNFGEFEMEVGTKSRPAFDRVISIEMLEHMSNYHLAFAKVSGWMKADAKMFVHVFTMRDLPYRFEEGWMSSEFFSGGQMPSDDLFFYFNEHLRVVDHWRMHGSHYMRTANAWAANMDKNRDKIMPILEATSGQGAVWLWKSAQR